jgi:pimeloyl-ACP methyl ester carboxylesterase
VVIVGRVLASVLVLAFVSVPPAPGAEPTTGSFDAKGVKIRYVEQGTGEPVVLVHGYCASAFLNWQLPGIFSALAKDYHVIALDLPGHGGSDKPETAEAYGPQMAEDVVLLMDHLHIPKAHVVGYSLGGMITVKLLTLHPDRVLSATVGGMGWVRDNGRNLPVPTGIAARDGGGPLAAVARSMGKLAVTEAELKSIKVPTTIVVGDQDRLKRMTVDPLRPVRPDWPVVEVKGANHMSCIAKQEFVDAIAAWLAKNRQKS